MKTAVIGLGNIAQKAYLPIITQIEDVEPYFCTRNEEVLQRLGKKYRVDKLYSSFSDFLKEDLDALDADLKTHRLCEKIIEK